MKLKHLFYAITFLVIALQNVYANDSLITQFADALEIKETQAADILSDIISKKAYLDAVNLSKSSEFIEKRLNIAIKQRIETSDGKYGVDDTKVIESELSDAQDISYKI